MKRWGPFAIIITCVLVGASVASAWSSPTHNASTGSEVRYLHTYHVGPSSSCVTDACGQGTVTPMAVHLPPSAHSYSGTITVSFDYLTSHEGTFRLFVALQTPNHRNVGTIVPSSRAVGPAPARDSTTVVFQIGNVRADTDLRLSTFVAATPPRSGRTSISSANMLVDARLSSH